MLDRSNLLRDKEGYILRKEYKKEGERSSYLAL